MAQGGRKGGTSIHKWKLWWGIISFQRQSSKLAHTFKLRSLTHIFINKPGIPEMSNPFSPPEKQTKCAEFYAQVAQNHTFPFTCKASLFVWGSCPGHKGCTWPCSTVKPTQEEACAPLCGWFHRASLVENNVLEVITTIITVVETVTVMWFISIPSKCQESELHSSEE